MPTGEAARLEGFEYVLVLKERRVKRREERTLERVHGSSNPMPIQQKGRDLAGSDCCCQNIHGPHRAY